ncbi:BNR repeat-containing protein [Reichenbachiella ulvae]|uniref:BNR repeat-containing protein n=1 Tax=Reichenbachiella ulvae TaxID=2980104 RepID=A0ABT3D0F6_9BACT|nr:BNR repeat-containing protein [Reichenbachiella ulvae]MCV9389372.1 BNR repeat-containing protein [Reichenbachiella ulvae]
MTSKKNILGLLTLLFIGFQPLSQDSGYLTKDGTWCWFSDPRAIKVDDNIITGWVKADGSIEARRLNIENQAVDSSELYFMLERDDHDNPAFTTTGNGEVITLYTRHIRKDLFINRLTDPAGEFEFSKPEFIHPMDPKEIEKFPRPTMTYANPFRLENENNRIYCFGRWVGFKPNMIWSDDDGKTWTKSKVFITNYPYNANNRPYVKYYSDGKSRIHITFTDGHPRVEPTNSVYYAYYENGSFYNAKGESISTMDQIPFEPKDASIVYTSNPEQGRAWVADIGQDKKGKPVILYTRSPTEQNHEYWYARYTKDGWIDQKICDSGPWFPQTPDGRKEWEPHYFGGMTIHPDNANVVYLSRQIDGVFEIERWETKDMGKTWSTETITENSEFDNVRPYLPRGLKAKEDEVVLWMENQKYIHYTNYHTSIKYLIRK